MRLRSNSNLFPELYSKTRDRKKLKMTISNLYHYILEKHIVSLVSSYFAIGGYFSYPNLNKNIKTCIKCKKHKNSTPKHKTILEPKQNYRLGTISNIKLQRGLNRLCMYLTLPSASAVVHKILLFVRSPR